MASTLIGSSGLTYDRVRAILWYECITTNTTVTYHLAVGGHGYGAYSTSAALNTSLSCSGQTTYTTSGQGGDFSSGTNVWLNPTSGYRTYTFARTTSKQTKTIYFSLTSTGSTISGTSSGSLTVTIPALPTYTVKYNANGGSGAPSSQTKTYGKTLTLTSSKPTRTGYTFSKWNTKSDGSGTNYSAGGSYTANAAVTLYAKWTANTYTLTYNANGGTVSPASKTITFGSTYGTLPTPTRTGYTFGGWYTAASGGSAVSASTSVSTTGNRTIYAHWTPITYSITYNYDGGSVSSENPSSYTPDTAAFTLTNPTKQYYNFIGWIGTGISGSALSVTVANGSTGNRSYTAIWERAYNPPSLRIDVSKRVNQSHVDDDSGTIAYISFTWTNGDDGGMTTVTPTTYDVILTNQDDPTDTIELLNQSLSAAPSTESVYTDNDHIAAEKRFTVEVILHIPDIGSQSYPDVTAVDYISEAYFIMDINSDGTAIGLGRAVEDSDSGLKVGFEATFDDDVNFYDDVNIRLVSGVMRGIVDFFYPVGSYYETSLPYAIPSGSSSPTTEDLALLGVTWFHPSYAWGGTWSLEAEGIFHVSAGSSADYLIGATGGEDKHQLIESELPKVTGSFRIRRYETSASNPGAVATNVSGVFSSEDGSATAAAMRVSSATNTGNTQVNLSFGNNGVHENRPPYIAVNRWHRTA